MTETRKYFPPIPASKLSIMAGDPIRRTPPPSTPSTAS